MGGIKVKRYFLICAVLMAAMIISPLSAMEKGNAVSTSSETESENDEFVSVMLSENGKIEKKDSREYVIGALAAETDMSCHEEALKAQAAACFTYMTYMKGREDKDKFNGADVSDSPENSQGYLSLEKRKEKWGENFEENEKKAEKIVDSVLNKLITYDGKPILAVYHELSSGTTRSAEAVWGTDYPYLQAVESPGDRLSPDYTKTVILNVSEFMSRAIKIKDVDLGTSAKDWLGKTETDENGNVECIYLDGKKISGEDFKAAFELPSCNFTVSYDNEKFKITSIGSGHMVGMSQYGADYMAKQGSDWKEILTHYYQNTEII